MQISPISCFLQAFLLGKKIVYPLLTTDIIIVSINKPKLLKHFEKNKSNVEFRYYMAKDQWHDQAQKPQYKLPQSKVSFDETCKKTSLNLFPKNRQKMSRWAIVLFYLVLWHWFSPIRAYASKSHRRSKSTIDFPVKRWKEKCSAGGPTSFKFSTSIHEKPQNIKPMSAK